MHPYTVVTHTQGGLFSFIKKRFKKAPHFYRPYHGQAKCGAKF
ncbi:hypothetical protein [uncultured Aggregatibacter sp.]|nr:hypothetical protein [uncultured Aggregatibacter sp.]